MKISSCKIFYSNSSLQIFVSFYISTKTIYLIKKKLTKTSKKLLTLRKLIFFNNKKKKNKEKLRLKLFKKNKKKPRYRSRSLKQKLQTKKLQKIKNKKNLLINKLNLYKTVNLKGFQEMLLESLATYTKNKINISLTLYNLNNHKRLKHAQIKNLKIIFMITDIVLYQTPTTLLLRAMPSKTLSFNTNDFMEQESDLPQILFITSFPPRECGIATYSQDLITALNNQFHQSFNCSICALESNTEKHEYKHQPKYILNTEKRLSEKGFLLSRKF